MQQYLEILKKYWGYDEFRPLQGDIIKSVASGRDTLGLMPTGGGKSLTFQVPAMAMNGVCIVVTPLIALMKDQVDNLKRRGIAAAAIYSGMSHKEILRTLDNAVFEAYKFLYVSPERLSTAIFTEKFKQMPVNLIAVDEAHCISQWGYDFRPSYLRIAEIRSLQPGVPLLALTATATPEVVDDIQEKLQFAQKNVFRKSFRRDNLVYLVRNTDQKLPALLEILKRIPGSSVVYVRSRQKTKEIADYLNQHSIKAEHFHAGLQSDVKDERQKRWKSDETRVIVATNAFGMGIDKPDVRTVVHMDLPDSLEAYFQEAGRAGRDEKKAYAILLCDKRENFRIKKRQADSFPPKDMVRKVYESLGNYLQIGVGSGLDAVFPFDISDFCKKFHLPALVAYSSLKILQQAGYVELTDEQDNVSSVLFIVDKDTLYDYRQTARKEQLIHLLLRSYTGLFTEPAYISETVLAKHLGWTQAEVYEELVRLAYDGVIRYIPRRKTPFLTYIREREETRYIQLGKEAYDDRQHRYQKRIESMFVYAQQSDQCRSRMLLAYFGEKDGTPCRQCDVCLNNKDEVNHSDTGSGLENIRTHILRILQQENASLSLPELLQRLPYNQYEALEVLRAMIEQGEVFTNPQNKLESK